MKNGQLSAFPSRDRTWYQNKAGQERDELQVKDVLSLLLPRLRDKKGWSIPPWPPDVFALCSAVLRRTGAYQGKDLDEKFREDTKKSAWEWVRWYAAGSKGEAPELIRKPWEQIHEILWDKEEKQEPVSLSQFAHVPGTYSESLVGHFLKLAVTADQAAEGFGLPYTDYSDPDVNDDLLLGEHRRRLRMLNDQALDFLDPTLWGSSLCKEIHPSRARVLPKIRTPSSGISYRQFSHHLAFLEPDEVRPYWHLIPARHLPDVGANCINLLLIPWPDDVLPSQFRASDDGFFSYEASDDPASVKDYFERLLKEAVKSAGAIHGVLLPETALRPREYEFVKEVFLKEASFLITGVGGPAPKGGGWHLNRLHFDVALSDRHFVSLEQSKHHRWRLDLSQVEQYNLGGRLSPYASENRDAGLTSWFEKVTLSDRRLTFVALQRWLVVTALICEDLAREDPVGEMIRSVAPHLLVALLMDGPQVAERWPARYATTLADDPGSSVLTLTSRGMVRLSRPRKGQPKKGAIALWKDQFGSVQEFSLNDDEGALVLSLSAQRVPERTLDGRSYNSWALRLSGVNPIKMRRS